MKVLPKRRKSPFAIPRELLGAKLRRLPQSGTEQKKGENHNYGERQGQSESNISAQRDIMDLKGVSFGI
jgi:hypothetical protein